MVSGTPGITEIWYDLEAGWNIEPGDIASMTLSEGGGYSIIWYSVDNLGNTMPISTYEVSLDNVSPETIMMTLGSDKALLTVTDEGVGECNIYYRTKTRFGWSPWNVGDNQVYSVDVPVNIEPLKYYDF